MASLIRRAFDLQCISDRQYKRLNEQLSSQGYKTNEPIPLPPEQPGLLRQVVEYHRRTLGYIDADMERLLYRSDWRDTLGEPADMPRLRISDSPIPISQGTSERKIM